MSQSLLWMGKFMIFSTVRQLSVRTLTPDFFFTVWSFDFVEMLSFIVVDHPVVFMREIIV